MYETLAFTVSFECGKDIRSGQILRDAQIKVSRILNTWINPTGRPFLKREFACIDNYLLKAFSAKNWSIV